MAACSATCRWHTHTHKTATEPAPLGACCAQLSPTNQPAVGHCAVIRGNQPLIGHSLPLDGPHHRNSPELHSHRCTHAHTCAPFIPACRLLCTLRHAPPLSMQSPARPSPAQNPSAAAGGADWAAAHTSAHAPHTPSPHPGTRLHLSTTHHAHVGCTLPGGLRRGTRHILHTSLGAQAAHASTSCSLDDPDPHPDLYTGPSLFMRSMYLS